MKHTNNEKIAELYTRGEHDKHLAIINQGGH